MGATEKCDEIVVRIPKGTQVRLVEVDNMAKADDGFGADRDLKIEVPASLKIGIRRVGADGIRAGASIVTMCG